MADRPGQPTKYREEHCAEIIECMGQGLSMTAFAGQIGVARSTINNWMAAHDEFLEAVKIGQAKRVLYLERRLLDGEIGPRVTSHIFALKNADPEEWKDKHHTTHDATDKFAEMMAAINGRTRGLPNGN